MYKKFDINSVIKLEVYKRVYRNMFIEEHIEGNGSVRYCINLDPIK